MFRSSTIIREHALNLAKVILRNYVVIYYAVVWQHVMEWRVYCMQHTRHSMTCCRTTT